MTRFYEAKVRVPILETERLILREFRLSDFPDFMKMSADPIVMRHIGTGTPQTPEEAWARFLRYAGHWQLLGYSFWLFADKMSGQFVGNGGFNLFERQMEPSLETAVKDLPEIGYVLASHAHGKGYASEAMRAAVAWGDQNLKTRQTTCFIDEENFASTRVAEKAGYKEFRRVISKSRPCILLMRENGADGGN